MPIQPIRFKTAKDLNNFLMYLQNLKFILLEKDSVKAGFDLEKEFLKASDGNIYLLNDVLQYLKEADEKEIEASKLSFYIGPNTSPTPIALTLGSSNLTLTQLKPVSLAQIKTDPSLADKLIANQLIASFFELLNPKLYASEPFPLLSGAQAIKEARVVFGNHKLIQQFDEINSSLKNDNFLLTKSHLYVPLAVESSNFLNDIEKDVYRITLVQQIKLKYRLLKELRLVKNAQERVALWNWISSINADILQIKQFLANLIEVLESHSKLTQEARLKYAKMIEQEPDLEKLKAKILEKNKESEELSASIKQLEDIFEILKPLTAYGTIATLYTLFLTALFLTPVLIILLTAPAPLLGLVLLTLESVAVILSVHPVVDAIVTLGELIENKFDSVIEEKNKHNKEVLEEVSTIRTEIFFRELFSKNSPDFIANGENNFAFIEEIEDEVLEIETFEAIQESKMTHIAGITPKISNSPHHLFAHKQRHSTSDISSLAIDKIEEQTLSRSVSFSS